MFIYKISCKILFPKCFPINFENSWNIWMGPSVSKPSSGCIPIRKPELHVSPMSPCFISCVRFTPFHYSHTEQKKTKKILEENLHPLFSPTVKSLSVPPSSTDEQPQLRQTNQWTFGCDLSKTALPSCWTPLSEEKQHPRPASPSLRPRRERKPPSSGCACWLHFDRSFPLSAPERHIQKAFLIQRWEPHEPIRHPPHPSPCRRRRPSHTDVRVFGTRPLSPRNISRQCLDSAVRPSAGRGNVPSGWQRILNTDEAEPTGVHIDFSDSRVLVHLL